jgi:ceramide glucosyltransferase
MTALAHAGLYWFGCALAAGAMIYAAAAYIAIIARPRPQSFRAAAVLPPVTVLKPLCGAEPETYECLRSFCVQSYPDFQVIFGVRDPNDPAAAVVARLQREFPRRDLRIAVNRRQHGSSRKVSNLINMMSLARNDFLVLSDSDVRVGPDYLAKIVAPLLDGSVGIVTCAYRGIPRQGLWPLLGSMFINEWFIPSVRVAALGGSRAFAFGATIAIRRQILHRIGGFPSVADQLADDYRLGELTRALGLRTVLSEVEVETCVVDRTFADLVRHELRWLRTIRAIRPIAYCFSFVTFGVPVAAVGVVLAGGAAPAVAMLIGAAAARILMHFSTRGPGSPAHRLAVLPLRDTLSLSLWIWSFFTRRVHWRDELYRVSRDGSVQPV